VDVSTDITTINENLTPASKLLNEAAAFYAEALNIKIKAAKADVKQCDLPGVPGIKSMVGAIPEITTGMDQWKAGLTEQQKELCGKGHEKLMEGTASFALVATPTALAIKRVTDSDPAGMLMRPDLAALGVLCAKDSAKLISFTKVAADFNKKWGAPVSSKQIPENAFASK
jgi:hypothetical protein